MTLVEFAERTSPVPLSEWQKNFLAYCEQAQRENRQMFICIPPRVGSRMRQIIRVFEMEQGK